MQGEWRVSSVLLVNLQVDREPRAVRTAHRIPFRLPGVISALALRDTTAVIARNTVMHGRHAAAAEVAMKTENVFATENLRGMIAVSVQMEWLAPSVKRNATRTRHVEVMEFALATGVAGARTHTAGQTAACV